MGSEKTLVHVTRVDQGKSGLRNNTRNEWTKGRMNSEKILVKSGRIMEPREKWNPKRILAKSGLLNK